MLHPLKNEEASYVQIIYSIPWFCSDFWHQRVLFSLHRQWWEQSAGWHPVGHHTDMNVTLACGASHWHERHTGLWGITLSWTSHWPAHFFSFPIPFQKSQGGIKTALAYCQSSGDLLRILNDACQVPSTRELGRAACKITGRKEEILRLLALCWLTFTGKDAFKK